MRRVCRRRSSSPVGVLGFSSTTAPTSVPLPEDAIAINKFVIHPEYSVEGVDDALGSLGNGHDVSIAFLASPITDVEPAIMLSPDESSKIGVGVSSSPTTNSWRASAWWTAPVN